MNLVNVLPIVLFAALFGAAWLYRRRQRQRTREPKCPVCRSRRLEGLIGEGDAAPAALGDDFECLDCGLTPGELDDRLHPHLETLRELQQVELPIVRGKQEFYRRLVNYDSRFLDTADYSAFGELGRRNTAFADTANELFDVWQHLDGVRREYPEVFDLQVPDSGANRTLSDLLTERLQGSEESGILQTAARHLPGVHLMKEAYRAEGTLEQIREAVAADLDERQAT